MPSDREMLLKLLEAVDDVLAADIKDRWRILDNEAARRFLHLQQAATEARTHIIAAGSAPELLAEFDALAWRSYDASEQLDRAARQVEPDTHSKGG